MSWRGHWCQASEEVLLKTREERRGEREERRKGGGEREKKERGIRGVRRRRGKEEEEKVREGEREWREQLMSDGLCGAGMLPRGARPPPWSWASLSARQRPFQA